MQLPRCIPIDAALVSAVNLAATFFNLMLYKAALRLTDLSLRTTQAFTSFPGRQWPASAG